MAHGLSLQSIMVEVYMATVAWLGQQDLIARVVWYLLDQAAKEDGAITFKYLPTSVSLGPSQPHLFTRLPKQHHKLETRCSNARGCGGYLSFSFKLGNLPNLLPENLEGKRNLAIKTWSPGDEEVWTGYQAT